MYNNRYLSLGIYVKKCKQITKFRKKELKLGLYNSMYSDGQGGQNGWRWQNKW